MRIREAKDDSEPGMRIVSRASWVSFIRPCRIGSCSDSDVLPFRILAKDPELCRNTTFIDIDYPKLIHEKVKIIRRTAQLHDLLDCVSTSTNTETILKSQNYIAIGCDLLDLNRLNQVLAEALDHEVSKCNFFCLAEASISYMEVERADALISWAASLGEGNLTFESTWR